MKFGNRNTKIREITDAVRAGYDTPKAISGHLATKDYMMNKGQVAMFIYHYMEGDTIKTHRSRGGLCRYSIR